MDIQSSTYVASQFSGCVDIVYKMLFITYTWNNNTSLTGAGMAVKLTDKYTQCQKKYNNASALSVGATVVTLNGVMKFSNNSGMNGGGIAVYDGGSIVIEKGFQAFFADNRAINKGPALYFSHVVPRYNVGCFLH